MRDKVALILFALALLAVAVVMGCSASDPLIDDIYTRGKIYLWDGESWDEVLAGAGGGGANDFLDLSDTPSSYVGEAGELIRVVETEDGLEFFTAAYLVDIMGESIFDLSDFPADPDADKYLKWDDDPGELIWDDAAGGGGATTFLDLTDVPDDYTGTGGQLVRVAATEDSLEFFTEAYLNDTTDIVNDTHIDWGSGANQVDADDISDGSTNAIVTLAQETNWDTHLSDTANPHSVTAAQAGAVPTIGSSTDNAVVRWDGVGGDATQNSGVTIDDSNVVTAADVSISSPSSIYNLDHDSFSGFVGNEHIDHSGVSITSGTGLTGGGDITTSRTLSLSHLGLENLSDPNADRIIFWDDGESLTDWLIISTGLVISGTSITTNDSEIDHDSLANTHNLTTDIDHDQLTNFEASEHFTQASITTVGTIATGIWQASVIDHERGGLEADVSAYNGLVKISGGVTSAITDNSTNWDTAFGWGDHSGEGYLINITGESTFDLSDFPADPNADKYLMWDDDPGVLSWEDVAGGGGATTALDNLASVAINTSLISDGDSTDDLGSSGIYWANTYSDKVYLNSTATLDGATAGRVNLTGTLQTSGNIGVAVAPNADRGINVLLAADDEYGVYIDQYSNDYTGASNNYLLYVQKDINSTSASLSYGQYVILDNVTEYSSLVTPATVGLGFLVELTGGVTGLFSTHTGYGIFGTSSLSTDFVDTSSFAITTTMYGGYFTGQAYPTVNKGGDTHTTYSYGGLFRSFVNPVITAGGFVGTSYGGHFTATGTTEGTQTAYGIYAVASGADTNYAGYFSGNVYITGTYTAAGGSDPPYVHYFYESRDSIVELIKENVPQDRISGATLFYNGSEDRMELFIPGTGEFRDLQGRLLERVEPITNTFTCRPQYYLNHNTGEIESFMAPVKDEWFFKENYELDSLTGRTYFVEKDEDGRVLSRVEVSLEEAIYEKTASLASIGG